MTFEIKKQGSFWNYVKGTQVLPVFLRETQEVPLGASKKFTPSASILTQCIFKSFAKQLFLKTKHFYLFGSDVNS